MSKFLVQSIIVIVIMLISKCLCYSTQYAFRKHVIAKISTNKLLLQRGRLLKSPASIKLFSSDVNKSATVDAKDTSIKSKVKELWNNYGYVAVGTYFGIYVTTLGSIFFGLDFDLFNAASVGLEPAAAVKKVCDIFENITGNGALPEYIRNHPRVGTFAIAWIITKFTEPVRLLVTLAIVPKFARFLGFVKSSPTISN